MEEKDIKNILEEIQLLKKEQEKLREENRAVKEENKQLKEFLKEKSILITNEEFQEYKRSSDHQTENRKELFDEDINYDMEFIDDTEFITPQKLYSISPKSKITPETINNKAENPFGKLFARGFCKTAKKDGNTKKLLIVTPKTNSKNK